MPYNNYIYTTDSGFASSISIPSDFATALGQTLATIQPPLDQTIAPRYANYLSAGGLRRQAVITDLATFSSIVGTTLVVDSVIYTCTGAVAEQIPPYVPNTVLNGVFLVQGPRGESGGGTLDPGGFGNPVADGGTCSESQFVQLLNGTTAYLPSAFGPPLCLMLGARVSACTIFPQAGDEIVYSESGTESSRLLALGSWTWLYRDDAHNWIILSEQGPFAA